MYPMAISLLYSVCVCVCVCVCVSVGDKLALKTDLHAAPAKCTIHAQYCPTYFYNIHRNISLHKVRKTKKYICVHHLQIDVTLRKVKKDVQNINAAISSSIVKWTFTYTCTHSQQMCKNLKMYSKMNNNAIPQNKQ